MAEAPSIPELPFLPRCAGATPYQSEFWKISPARPSAPESRELVIRYKKTDGTEQVLSLAELLERRAGFEMAYNPNDCGERCRMSRRVSCPGTVASCR